MNLRGRQKLCDLNLLGLERQETEKTLFYLLTGELNFPTPAPWALHVLDAPLLRKSMKFVDINEALGNLWVAAPTAIFFLS